MKLPHMYAERNKQPGRACVLESGERMHPTPSTRHGRSRHCAAQGASKWGVVMWDVVAIEWQRLLLWLRHTRHPTSLFNS